MRIQGPALAIVPTGSEKPTEITPQRQPIDGIDATPVRLPGSPPPFAPGIAHAAVGLTKEVAKTIDPSRLLECLDNAEVQISVPGTIGQFGHFPASYTVEPNTLMTLNAVVENGRIVPEKSKLVFQPKLDALAWVKTQGVSLKPAGDRAKIELNLSWFPDLNITKLLLDMKTIPLGVSELLKVVIDKKDELQGLAQYEGIERAFDPAGFQIDLKKATFKKGFLPLGDNAAIELQPGNELSASGTKDDLRMSGKIKLASYALGDGRSSIDGGALEADANIRLALDSTLKQPTQLTVDLQNVNGKLDLARLDDGQGNRLTLGSTTLADGRIALQQGRGLTVQLPNVTTHLGDAQLTVEQNGVPLPLSLGGGEFTGRFGMLDNVISVDAKSAKLSVSAKDVSFGDGALQLGYASVDLVGRGQVEFDGKTATVSGLLGFQGQIKNGSIGTEGGPMFVNLEAGAAIGLEVNQATFGPGQRTFRGNGQLKANISSGEVLLPSGHKITLGPGSTAEVNATQLIADAGGFSAKGRITLATSGSAEIDPKALASDKVSVQSISGSRGRIKVILDDVSLEKNGRFHIGNAEARVAAKVTEVTGKLRSAPSLVEAKDDTAVGRVKRGLAVTPPSLDQVFGAVADANVSFSLPLPAGSVGVWPLNVRIKPGTTAAFAMNVKDGLIDRESVRLTFTPPIDGPLWIDGAGIQVNKNGDFIVDLKGFPNIDVSKLLFGAVKMPKTLDEIAAMAAKIQSALNSSLGQIVLGPREPVDPLETLNKLGAKFEASNVRMNGKTLSLGDRASIQPGDAGRYTLQVAGGIAHLTGRGDINDGNIADDATLIQHMSGSAELDVTISKDRVDARLVGIVAKADRTELTRPNGDRLRFTQSSIGNGDITITTRGKERAQLLADFKEVHSKLETSRFTGKQFALDIPDAAFSGAIQVSPERIAGQGTVHDMTISLPPLQTPLAVTGGVLKASGAFAFDSSTGQFDVADATATLKVAEAQLGDTLRIGADSTMTLNMAKASLGDGSIDATGSASLALQEGELVLGGAKLHIQPGTRARLDIASLHKDKDQKLGALQGKLAFAATLTGELKDFTPAPGVTIERVGKNEERVRVYIDSVSLAADGSFALRDIALALRATAEDVGGFIGDTKPLRNGLVFLKSA